MLLQHVTVQLATCNLLHVAKLNGKAGTSFSLRIRAGIRGFFELPRSDTDVSVETYSASRRMPPRKLHS